MGLRGILSEIKREKLYKGTYEYISNDTIYSKENFNVYQHSGDSSLAFLSSMISRVSTGELLVTNVEYTVTREMVPKKVAINREIDDRSALEMYVHDVEKGTLNYFFIEGDNKKHIEIPVGGKFHVTTPTTASSMLFIRSKRESATNKNYYSIYVSNNQWEFLEGPTIKSVVLQRDKPTTDFIKVGGSKLPFLQYLLHEHKEPEGNNIVSNKSSLQIFLNRNISIPYMLKDRDNTVIKMTEFIDFNSE